jgi:DNA-binding Lrp family transcriptional regulator
MDKIKLDLKDKRILDELDRNPNIYSSALGKKVGLSRQVIEYRLEKLLSQKTIYSFYTLIDVGKLGYSSFRVHLKIKNISPDSYLKFAKALYLDYPTFWVAFISGSFDIIIDIFAKNSNEFEEIFSQIIQKNKEIIQSYEILTILNLDLYNYGDFIESKQKRRKISVHRNIADYDIDDADKKILQAIKHNSRIPYEIIGKKLNLARNTVKNRILKLEEKEIIAGYKILVNFAHFDKQSFKIFIKYNNAKIDQEKSLLEFLENKKGILNTLKLLGKWNLDIELHIKNVKELQEFIIDLRNRYDIIEDYEIIQIIEEYGIDFYPAKLVTQEI